MKGITETKGYARLLRLVRAEITRGMIRSRRAIEREKTVTYWRIGKHIARYLLHQRDRAEYGKKLFEVLAWDLGIHQRVLYHSVQFYEKYSDLNVCSQLSWSHFRILTRIGDVSQRSVLEKKAIQERLTCRQLDAIVKRQRQEGIRAAAIQRYNEEPRTNMSTVSRGLLDVYVVSDVRRFPEQKQQVVIDCGFNCFQEIHARSSYEWRRGECVKLGFHDESVRLQHVVARRNQLFTYKARVHKILDAVTLWMDIECGWGVRLRQKLALRGIALQNDGCEGNNAACRFIEGSLAGLPFVIIKTYAHDLSELYDVDLWYLPDEQDLDVILKQGRLLNQELRNGGYVHNVM